LSPSPASESPSEWGIAFEPGGRDFAIGRPGGARPRKTHGPERGDCHRTSIYLGREGDRRQEVGVAGKWGTGRNLFDERGEKVVGVDREREGGLNKMNS
jgi:hypothetical protein